MSQVSGTSAGRRQTKGILGNSVLNFVGQVVPLGVAAVAVPLIIHDMGLERYGLLSLTWILLGYFSFLDLGLGRATTNAVADLDASGKNDQIGAVVFISLLLNLLVGILAGGIGWYLSPWLAQTAFALPAGLVEEGTQMFAVLATSVPVITVAATLRGVLEGYGRFDLSNAVKAPSLALMFLLPLLYKPLRLKLGEVVGLIVISRLLAVIVFVWFVWTVDRRALNLRSRLAGSGKQLIHYAGWVTISNIFSPVLNYAERLLLAAMVPVGMIGFYTAPYEIISRLPMIPSSIGATLFPAYSAISGNPTQAEVQRLFVRPTKFILLVVTPLAAVFVFFSGEILSLWLGKVFEENARELFALLAIGFFFNCLAHVPLAASYGLGRPDVRGKIDVIEALVFAGLAYLAIRFTGITGAASAKTVVYALDTSAMFLVVRRIMSVGWRTIVPESLVALIVASVSFLAVGAVLELTGVQLIIRVVLFVVMCGAFASLSFTRFLTSEERAMALRLGRISELL